MSEVDRTTRGRLAAMTSRPASVRRRTVLRGAVAATAAAALPPAARAQALQKTATVVVPFPPGGTTDLVGRLLADRLRGAYAPTVIVDNKAGAGGRIGIAASKALPKDGSAMLLSPASMFALYPHVFKELGYSPLKDFVPVSRLVSDSFCAVVGPAVPASVRTLAEFVAWCDADPKRASYGSPAPGSGPHLMGAQLGQKMKVPFTHVPYNGGGPVVVALLGEQIPITFVNYNNVTQHVASGRLRVLANSAAVRSSFLPDVPTMTEAGYRELTLEEWFGIFVPEGTPAPVVRSLHGAIQEAMKSPQIAAALAPQSLAPMTDTPEAFAATLKADHDRWAEVVRSIRFDPQ